MPEKEEQYELTEWGCLSSKEALPRIEEEVVIQETDAIESGKAIAIEREKLEAWTYGNVD